MGTPSVPCPGRQARPARSGAGFAAEGLQTTARTATLTTGTPSSDPCFLACSSPAWYR